MPKYIWDPRAPILNKSKSDPNDVWKAFATMKRRHGGITDTTKIVKEAREAKTPEGKLLHKHYEWRVHVAAQLHWERQTRDIMAAVKILFHDDDDPDEAPSALIALKVGQGRRDYIPIQDVLESAELRRLMLKQALSELRSFEIKYKRLTEICNIVQRARKRLEKLIETEDDKGPPKKR